MEHKLLTTAKLAGQTKAQVRQAAAKQNPGYRVVSVEAKEDEWEVRLAKTSDRVSTQTRQAAPPPFVKDEEKDDAGDDDDAPADDEGAEDDEAKGDTDDGDSDTEDKGEKGDSKKKDPVAQIQSVISELKGLLDQLEGHAGDLKDKADKVDEIHELTKGDGDMVGDMDSVPPVPGMDGPGGPEGAPPVPPRKPPVPSGKGARPPVKPMVGVPTFTKRQTHIVEHPIKDDDGEYSLADFLSAVSSDERFADYKVAEVKALADKNVYVGKLTLEQ